MNHTPTHDAMQALPPITINALPANLSNERMEVTFSIDRDFVDVLLGAFAQFSHYLKTYHDGRTEKEKRMERAEKERKQRYEEQEKQDKAQMMQAYRQIIKNKAHYHAFKEHVPSRYPCGKGKQLQAIYAAFKARLILRQRILQGMTWREVADAWDTCPNYRNTADSYKSAVRNFLKTKKGKSYKERLLLGLRQKDTEQPG